MSTPTEAKAVERFAPLTSDDLNALYERAKSVVGSDLMGRWLRYRFGARRFVDIPPAQKRAAFDQFMREDWNHLDRVAPKQGIGW